MDEQEQREQYELQLEYNRQQEQQYEDAYMQHCHECHHIAEGWLLGELTDGSAEEHLRYAGDNEGLLSWAEDVLKHTRMADDDEIPF